jgi:CHAD domain-containing protein
MKFDIERLHKSARRVIKFVKRNSSRPGSKAVHDLRTSIRSLETAFSTLGLDAKKRSRRLLKDLRTIRKGAGKVRDMDVLTADVLSLQPNGEQDCTIQLLEHLGAERKKFATQLRRLVDHADARMRRRLKHDVQCVEGLLRDAQANPQRSDVPPKTLARTIQLAAELQEPVRFNSKNLHPYRLKVKELRDVLQLSNVKSDAAFLKELNSVKDAIGEWHDWEQLIAIAVSTLDHGASCGVIKQLKSTSSIHYRQAMVAARRLRSRSSRQWSATRALDPA